MTQKEEVLQYFNSPAESKERNSMGCSESWYDPYYAIMRTFSKEEIESMSDAEVANLVKLAENLSDAFY